MDEDRTNEQEGQTSLQLIKTIANGNKELYNKLIDLRNKMTEEYNEQLDKHIRTFKFFQNI